jgi:signal transduction histidine kinase
MKGAPDHPMTPDPLSGELMPRLSKFIREHTEEILVEWEAFARSIDVPESMDIAALRDHAKEMLGVIAKDLDTPQTSGEQSDKSEGKSDAKEGANPTAAQEHGAARALSGFSVAQMLSELRALRASVLRLWTRRNPQLAETDLEDMTRFNEAIDQAIAESAAQYSEHIAQSKDRFLAILGHDLRNPLGAITMSASFMLETNPSEQHRVLIERIEKSARRMTQMVADLLDYTRTTFGDTIPIAPKEMDVTRMVQDVVAEVATRYPDSRVQVLPHGELRGEWDQARLTQALTNLVSNAVQHGAEKSPVTVAVEERPGEVAISVRNKGPVIPEKELARIVEPGIRGDSDSARADEHLGLGLYIVDRIVAAHGGRLDVRSRAGEGTSFTMRLPRAS